jgi:hypothetical protein
MKLILALLGIGVGCVASAFAQGVTVEVVFDQDYFLPHETLVAKVRITNFSGQALELGKDDDWLTFMIEGRNNRVVPKLAFVPVEGEFSLESSKTATRLVDLAPYFDLSRPDHYKIVASVRLPPKWQRTIQSAPKGFDIITGTKLWWQDFGLPPTSPSDSAAPEIRKYALVQTIHQSQLKLYLRLSDAAESRVFRIFPIGPMVSFSKPEPQLDKFGNLHVLYQIGAKGFNYSVVSPDGLLIARETHDYSNSRPVLRADQDGRISVTGGTRRITASDLPPPSSLSQSSDVESPKP